MSLRRKLLTGFGALAVLGLILAGVTVYAIVQWSATEESLRGHYVRSLRAQEVRAITFRACKEIPDALATEDPDARQEFAAALEPSERAFVEWESLAEDEEEQAQVASVRAAFDQLVTDAGAVFDLVDQGDRPAAIEMVETVLEDRDFERFETLTAAAVESGRDKRRELVANAEAIRRTATLTLAVTGIGVLAVTLLVAAYLSGDLFRPLRELRVALAELASGDREVRLDSERGDELGAANRAFNDLAEQVTAVPAHDQLAAPPARPQAVTEPASLLRDAVADVDAELISRRITVEIAVDPGLDPIRVDRAGIRDALAELVRNALDALPDRGGRMTLRAAPAGDAVSLEVADDGAGISPDVFARLECGAVRSRGLRVATTVARQHGGRFLIRNRSSGGTLAQLLLPTGH